MANILDKIKLSFSYENGDSMEVESGDESFYEEIEAPKFVDFTVPDHYCPDDRYWFCLRVGCDQKHEEEMDSEAIYKNFVLRVMAARSPNVRLQKALNKNCLRTPRKCPLSAPPKSSKSRLSRLAVISSISQKITNDKAKAAKPVPKLISTPMTKGKPVAAKYLTTPRNRKCGPDANSCRSVRNPKSSPLDVPKNRLVAKALVFHSPKKTKKVKTSVELRTPLTKLCEGMKKLEITSRKKQLLENSKASKNLEINSSRTPLHGHKTPKPLPAKPVRCTSCKAKGNLLQQFRPKEMEHYAKLEDGYVLDDLDKGNSIESQTPNREENDGNKENELDGSVRLDSVKECESSTEYSAEKDCSQRELREDKVMDSDDKENDAASKAEKLCSQEEVQVHEAIDYDEKENTKALDENRVQNHNDRPSTERLLGIQDMSGNLKKIAQGQKTVNNLVCAANAPLVKFSKPKPTNPKPFRLRTDERGILREATLERKVNLPSHQNDAAMTLGGKLQKEQVKDVQKQGVQMDRSNSKMVANTTPKRHPAPTNQDSKPVKSNRQSNAIKRLEKFRKMRSLQKHPVRPQRLVPGHAVTTSYMTPGQKLEVIHEISPGISEPTSAEKQMQKGDARERRPVTIAKEPNLHSTTHVPSSCTRKVTHVV